MLHLPPCAQLWCVHLSHKLPWACCREHPVDWEAPAHPLAAREPRHGRRAALAATLRTPAGPLLVYNLHLEVRQLPGMKLCPYLTWSSL
jgi:endonuclease/exonuclease/phosphatase family metal-dependent hydrolase